MTGQCDESDLYTPCENWTIVREYKGVTLESCDTHRTEFMINDQIVMGDPAAIYSEWRDIMRALDKTA